ncbi:phosphoglyceromutase [Candidatus Omnitrophus magneticus]|uniref:2,3-bisphosphoglycerate-independent phosphoglycerate mutase n=1 Tax=Candidatus Omnitrophus magneticus TaxID=1609969 RepID=A0A0F0CU41_9BACT|nr:phosphoglyceromutase [Candidatus Omnitrophus magneticus]
MCFLIFVQGENFMNLKLEPLKNPIKRKGPVLLIIMDGIGIGKHDETDGVFTANDPCLKSLFQGPFFTKLEAHGKAVGLPSDDDMGNSEVGHNALGAGRVFAQGAKRVNAAIEDGSMFKTDLWQELVNRAKSGHTFHFIGLLSDGNVHSHINHLFSMIKKLFVEGVKTVRIHALLDGRDVGEKSALTYIEQTENILAEINKNKGYDYKIASGGGRMITTMDRYNADWEIVKRGWNAHVLGNARVFNSAKEAVETFYKEDEKITDQYLPPFVIGEGSEPVGRIKDGDSVIFFNFRGDRAIEISRAFDEKQFKEFDRVFCPDFLFAGLMEYDGDLHVPARYLVSPPEIDRTISEYLCSRGIKMFAISETQKFGHVTYFWNGNKSGYICKEFEDYFEIPSDKVRFEEAPKMKAFEITEKTIELLKSGKYKFGRLNLANGDMVGHTAVPSAIKIAVETVDQCVSRLLSVIKELDGIAIITADHGNSDEMFTIDKKGKHSPKTAHTLNPVPFIIYDPSYKGEYSLERGAKQGLSNVAATIINFLGFEKPGNYDNSLIKFLVN